MLHLCEHLSISDEQYSMSNVERSSGVTKASDAGASKKCSRRFHLKCNELERKGTGNGKCN